MCMAKCPQQVLQKLHTGSYFAKYGTLHRTFTHGLVHGMITVVFFGLPIMATNAMFERRGWKYVMINFFYWFITVGIMGGIVCGWPK